MGPSSFQWCPVTGQGAMSKNWSRGRSVWTWESTSSLWGWQSTGTGCPGRLWSLLLWRYSRPAWTRSCAICCSWPCLGRRVRLGDPQRSLPNPTILWFCDSVIPHLAADRRNERMAVWCLAACWVKLWHETINKSEFFYLCFVTKTGMKPV